MPLAEEQHQQIEQEIAQGKVRPENVERYYAKYPQRRPSTPQAVQPPAVQPPAVQPPAVQPPAVQPTPPATQTPSRYDQPTADIVIKGALPPVLQPREKESERYRAETVHAQNIALRLGNYKPEELAKAQVLYPWVGNPPDLSQLSVEQMNALHAILEAERQTSGFHKRLKEASNLIAELGTLRSAVKYAEQVDALLAPERVGLRGKSQRTLQAYLEQLPVSDATREALLGYRYDPLLPELEVTGHLIGYVHATAAKRIGSGAGTGQRGVTQYDVEHVTSWFDPFALGANVKDLRRKLKRIRDLVQLVRPDVEDELRAHGIDPNTLGPIPGHTFEEGGGTRAPLAPEPSAPLTDEDAATMRGGR